MVQNLQMKPQVITYTFSGDLFSSNGSKQKNFHLLKMPLPGRCPLEPLDICAFVTSSSCLPVWGGGGGTVGSESSDEASSHKVQFFKGVVQFQW